MTDNNNFEEFEHAEEHPEEPAAAPKGLRGAWRTQPMFKLLILIVVVAAVVAIAISYFSDGGGKSAIGLLKPQSIHEAPGGTSSAYHNEQTQMANEKRTKEAEQSGGSALPTPIGPATDTGELGGGLSKEDPLNELHAEVENLNKQLQEQKQAQTLPPPPQQQEQFDDTLAQAMQRQMTQLLDSWAPKGTKTVAVYNIDKLEQERQKDQSAQTGTSGAGGTEKTTNNANPTPKTIVPAGTVSYAQLLTEANSDVPGPILAQVVSGPLNGARVVGHFQVANGYSDYLTLTFSLADQKGVDYKIHAVALDPDTTLGGMATEVDERYFTRLVLPAAAGFLQGFSSALGQGNSSITTNGTTTIIEQSGKSIKQGEYTGLSQAANTASQFFLQQANLTKPLVRVAAGTPMGLFFVDSVTDKPLEAGQATAGGQQPGYAESPYNQNPYGQSQAYGQNAYGQGYGNGGNNYGAGGYPVLYPGATTQGALMNSGFGLTSPYGNVPGSNVYYTR